MTEITIINKCCCCGGDVICKYNSGDEVSKSFAEATDVCPACYEADCKVLTGCKCNVTGEAQVQYIEEVKHGLQPR